MALKARCLFTGELLTVLNGWISAAGLPWGLLRGATSGLDVRCDFGEGLLWGVDWRTDKGCRGTPDGAERLGDGWFWGVLVGGAVGEDG